MSRPSAFDKMRRQRAMREHVARKAALRQCADLWPDLEAEAFKHPNSEQLAAKLREIDIDAVHAKLPVRRWWHRVFKRGDAA